MKQKVPFSNKDIAILNHTHDNKIINLNEESNIQKNTQKIVQQLKKTRGENGFEVKMEIDKYNYTLLPEITKTLLAEDINKLILVFNEPNNKNSLPPLGKIITFIHKSIDYALLINKFVKTENIPYCFMIAYKRYMKENNENKKRKSKTKICTECKYNIICDGLWNSYWNLYGQEGIKPITSKNLITDNERCMISILLKENKISTKNMLKLKVSNEFKDICANCVGSDDVIVTGNNLIEKGVIKKKLTENGFTWSFVDNYKSILKEKGFL